MGIAEEQLKVTARINDQESIKNLVAGGLGVSIISERAALNFVQEKRVLLFDLPEHVSQRYLYFVMKRNYVLSEHIRAFITHVKKYYALDGTP